MALEQSGKRICSQTRGKKRLFVLLPYSPYLNPVEWVWVRLKKNQLGRRIVESKAQFIGEVNRQMRRLENLFGRFSNALIWIGGVSAGVVLCFTVVEYVYSKIDNPEDYLLAAKNCLEQAHLGQDHKSISYIRRQYLCTREKLTLAANKGQLVAFYALANLYAEKDIGSHFDMTSEELGAEAIKSWCIAREGGLELARVVPPFLKTFSLDKSNMSCQEALK